MPASTACNENSVNQHEKHARASLTTGHLRSEREFAYISIINLLVYFGEEDTFEAWSIYPTCDKVYPLRNIPSSGHQGACSQSV